MYKTDIHVQPQQYQQVVAGVIRGEEVPYQLITDASFYKPEKSEEFEVRKRLFALIISREILIHLFQKKS